MTDDAPLSAYGELVEIIDNLPLIVREARRARGLSMRRACAEIDGSASTVMRIERGQAFNSGTLKAVLRWLDQTPQHL